MATYYLDYVNGNDANNGTSWSSAKKTIDGFTSLPAGSIVKIAKSPDPTPIGYATWTNLSRVITLDSPVTQNIEMCESLWTWKDPNVSQSTTTTAKEGSYAIQFSIASAFTTGKIAYKTLSSTLDLSSYQQISFWFRTSAAIGNNVLKICLCSDNTGDNIVDEFIIPAVPSANKFVPFTIDKGSALGSSINSIAIYAIADPGTPTIIFDNIIACKAPSADDSLSLTSLISKNSQAKGGTEEWFCIKSINGTSIEIDNGVNSLRGSGKGYYGATERVMTYKRETIKTMGTTQTVQVSNIQFQGGYNPSTDEQDGETFFDGQCGAGYGISISSSKSYITIDYVNFCRYDIGFYIYGSNITLNNIRSFSNSSYGILKNNIRFFLNNVYINNNDSYGIYFQDGDYNFISFARINNNNNYGFYIMNTSKCNSLNMNINNNTYYGLYLNTSYDNHFRNVITNYNSSGGIWMVKGNSYLYNSLINEPSEISIGASSINNCIFSHKHDQTENNHAIFLDGGQIHTDSSITYTGNGISWRLDVTSTSRSSIYPLELLIAKVAVEANKQTTISAYFRRNNTGITGRLICKRGQIAGVDNDVYTDMTASANTWQQLQISFTPTENGVVEIYAQAWGGTSYSVWVDQIEITQE